MVQSTRILIADDHPLVRGALRQAVSGAVKDADIVEAADLDALSKSLAENDEVDLVLLDLAMPGVRGFSGLLYLRAQYPGVPVVVVSANEDRGVMRRLASLTPQQVRVLMMLSEGLLNKQIAYELTVSEATVKAHVSAILQKLGVESRTQAVIVASKSEAGQWQGDKPAA